MIEASTVRVFNDIESQDPFARIPKQVLNDDRLSWKAKGLLAYLLGKPKDWQVMVADLINRSKDGKTAIRSGLKELKMFGYAKHACIRKAGQITGWEWHVSNRPQFQNGDETIANNGSEPDLGFPDLDFPDLGFPDLGNRPPTNNELTKNEVTKNEKALPAEAVLWNAKVSGSSLSQVLSCSATRLRHLIARRADPFWTANFPLAVDKVLQSSFCCGAGNTGWKVSFDFMLQPDSVAKIVEGKYADREKPKPAKPQWISGAQQL